MERRPPPAPARAWAMLSPCWAADVAGTVGLSAVVVAAMFAFVVWDGEGGGVGLIMYGFSRGESSGVHLSPLAQYRLAISYTML